MVVEKTVMVPRTALMCPHCASEIPEKGIYYDGTNWFHRAATCIDKPMRMPPSKYEFPFKLGKEVVNLQTPCGTIPMATDGTPTECHGRDCTIDGKPV